MFTTDKTPLSSVNDATQRLGRVLGQRYVDESTGTTYMYVKFVGSAFVDGQAVIWSTTAGAVTLAGTTEANVNILAGVVVGAKTQNYFGYIAVVGPYDEVLVNGSTGGNIAIGDELGLGATSGRLMKVTAVRAGRIIAQEAATADAANIRVFVRC